MQLSAHRFRVHIVAPARQHADVLILNGGAISWRSSRQVGVTLSSSEAEFVAASQTGQVVQYLRVFLKGFGIQKYWSIMLHVTGSNMMSENLANRDRHVDVTVNFLRYLVRDSHLKIVQCADTQISDALTESFARPAFEKQREHVGAHMYMWVLTCIPCVSSNFSQRTRRGGGQTYPLSTPTTGVKYRRVTEVGHKTVETPMMHYSRRGSGA